MPPIAWGSGLQFMFPICIMGPCQQFINYTWILSNIFYLVEVLAEDTTFPAMDSFSLPPVDNGVIVCLSTHALMQWWVISHHSYPSLSTEPGCFKNKYQMEKEVHRLVTKYLFKTFSFSLWRIVNYLCKLLQFFKYISLFFCAALFYAFLCACIYVYLPCTKYASVL